MGIWGTSVRFYRQTSTQRELKAIIKYAKKTCNTEMKAAMSNSLDHAVPAAQAVAPVYNPAHWLTWWNYEHHYTPPGTLKRSIRHTRPVCHGRGTSYSAQFRADASFADELENGFRHRLAHKVVPGHFFMRAAYNQVFIPTWQLEMRASLERMFMTKAT